MIVLGTESSCVETAAALVRDGDSLMASVVASQEEVHRRFGGVVPELASRRHLEAIIPVMRKTLTQADVGLAAIDGVAATRGPGLIGSLLVGFSPRHWPLPCRFPGSASITSRGMSTPCFLKRIRRRFLS